MFLSVVVCIFSYTRELTREFMSAVSRLNMNTAEYAYILPWLQSGPKDASPWTGTSGEVLQQVKDTYANAIIVDDVNGFDNIIVDTFMTRIEKYGMNREDIDLTNTFAYLHLYDSLKLYALAARRVLNKTMEMDGNGTEAVLDGHQIWNAMRRLSFEGIGSVGAASTGFVQMDDLADRAPQFAAFFIAPNRDKVLKMVQMTAYRVQNCDGLINKSGCYDLKLADVMTGFWPSENGSLPSDEPICGFRGQRCSYTIEIAIGFTILALILLILLAWMLRRYCQTRALNKMSWRLFCDDFRLIDEETAKSLLSLASGNTKLSNMSTGGNRKHAILGVNTHATYRRFVQKQPLKFLREDLVLLTAVKDAVHDNINPFLGMSFNEKEEMYILWKFCSRGTIQDIVYNKNMTLDEKFHAAFVRDITLGLEYLHLSKIGFHGALNPSACVIDRNWSVRLTDFGLANMLERWLKESQIVPLEEDKKEEAEEESRNRSGGKDNYCIPQNWKIEAFGKCSNLMPNVFPSLCVSSVNIYCPPEMLKNREQNRRRRIDQSWVQQSVARKQAGDIYAFGIVMYEILFRTLPFPKDIDLSVVGSAGDDGSRHIRPTIQDKETTVHPDLAALLIDCWSQNAEIRPSIRRVRLNTELVLKCRGSLVEQMMRVMEQYANNLEKLVKERTEMLEEANTRAERLLNQLLPPYVAVELKAGRRVPPEMFSSATILFSNIVGFTRICQESSPLEVVTLLNGIYAGFDEKILEHGAYKVETIGDAYMIVAGIPPPKEQNAEAQTKHVEQVSSIALSMRKFLEGFEIPHRRREKVKCRWGFHSGPVAAGVVGLTAPRYCLFGDTVNTSSRMESTGLPEKIQISEQSFMMLSTHYPEFVCEHRGQVEIKGKGLCTTYWLIKKSIGHMSAEQRQLHSFQKFY
ncbi:hypothetical protein niasHT_007934 [Heterodera trifolii]|uniref:Guanylate cyclase n=1 Tax=Heterodera trifolii TaxID=157864 RepID=A0ABD2M0L0_9BILA